MGREIRRVPEGWEHPRNDDGRYMPLFDEPLADAMGDWLDNWEAWQRGEAEYQGTQRDYASFVGWHGQSPDPDYYRPAWDAEPTCYQVYETVSEGTPVSPVFATTGELIDWLVDEGHTRESAERFVEVGSAPSFVVVGNTLLKGIDALNLFGKETE